LTKRYLQSLAAATRKLTELAEKHQQQIFENAQLNYQIRQAEAQRVEELAGFAHELKKPLTVIRSLLYRCSKKASQELILQTAEEIDNEITRAVRMLDNILTLARLELIETSKFESVSLSEIAQAAFDQQQTNFPQHTWKASITPNLRLVANAEAIFAICENLLENAGKHSSATSKIILTVKKNPKFATLVVKDTGVGIPKSIQKNITQPFFHRSAASGFGLGLAVVTRAVSKLGGELRFTSKPKQGSTFTVKLPR